MLWDKMSQEQSRFIKQFFFCNLMHDFFFFLFFPLFFSFKLCPQNDLGLQTSCQVSIDQKAIPVLLSV